MATDIAFALGVLALLGSRVPPSLKVFLTALAIIDDLGAIVVIALFYTEDLSWLALALAALALAVLIGFNRLGVTRLWPYLLVGAVLWVLVLKSGVHATLAGVALALTVPMGPKTAAGDSRDKDPGPLRRLEHGLHLWVAFAVIPIFGFANAGVRITGMQLSDALAPLPLGIAFGLLLGKQLGVFGAAWLAIRSGVATLPAQVDWAQLYGVALLCGIGFTMSLFIGALAFPGAETLAAETRLGVIAGSLASILCGVLVLRATSTRAAPA